MSFIALVVTKATLTTFVFILCLFTCDNRECSVAMNGVSNVFKTGPPTIYSVLTLSTLCSVFIRLDNRYQHCSCLLCSPKDGERRDDEGSKRDNHGDKLSATLAHRSVTPSAQVNLVTGRSGLPADDSCISVWFRPHRTGHYLYSFS